MFVGMFSTPKAYPSLQRRRQLAKSTPKARPGHAAPAASAGDGQAGLRPVPVLSPENTGARDKIDTRIRRASTSRITLFFWDPRARMWECHLCMASWGRSNPCQALLTYVDRVHATSKATNRMMAKPFGLTDTHVSTYELEMLVHHFEVYLRYLILQLHIYIYTYTYLYIYIYTYALV